MPNHNRSSNRTTTPVADRPWIILIADEDVRIARERGLPVYYRLDDVPRVVPSPSCLMVDYFRGKD